MEPETATDSSRQKGRTRTKQRSSEGTDTYPIQAHEASDGLYFCTFGDDVMFEFVERVEMLFYRVDDERRVTDALTPEPERESEAPTVGELVMDADGVVELRFDLSEWYPEEKTATFEELPEFPTLEHDES